MPENHVEPLTGRGRRARRLGFVTSDKANKTIRVEMNRTVQHPKYGKYIRRRTTVQAHDEKNEAKVGDQVEIVACRPMSKTKRWRLARIMA